MVSKINTKLVIHLLLHQAKDFEDLRDANWEWENSSLPDLREPIYKGRAEAYGNAARQIHQLRVLLEEGEDI